MQEKPRSFRLIGPVPPTRRGLKDTVLERLLTAVVVLGVLLVLVFGRMINAPETERLGEFWIGLLAGAMWLVLVGVFLIAARYVRRRMDRYRAAYETKEQQDGEELPD